MQRERVRIWRRLQVVEAVAGLGVVSNKFYVISLSPNFGDSVICFDIFHAKTLSKTVFRQASDFNLRGKGSLRDEYKARRSKEKKENTIP